MVKDKEMIEQAYNDSKQITEQFNKNILNVVNKLVETNFDPDFYQHVAFYNEDLNRIEMHLKAIKHQEIRSTRFDQPIRIEKGETIHTENSYKYTLDQIKELAEKSHFQIERLFTDKNNWFSLVIFMKTDEA
jgi:L-histidine N-alpha-methyltransferase